MEETTHHSQRRRLSSSEDTANATLLPPTHSAAITASDAAPHPSQKTPSDDNDVDKNITNAKKPQTPLPVFQLFMLFFIMFTEPVTATVIYPFINALVQETGVTHGDEKRTGYFAGIIESVFFVTEALTVYHWGWASDRIGRRPVLLLGPLGLALTTVGFGLAKSFWPLVFFRSLQGVFNGNIGVSKTALAEVTDETNIADAFAMMPLVWSVGITLGPIVGGVLAQPAIQWPNSFGRIKLFRVYPYLLACGFAGVIAFLCYLIALVGFKETLPSLVAARKQSQDKDSEQAESAGLLANADGIDYGTTTTGESSNPTSHTPTPSSSSSSSTIVSTGASGADEKPVPFRGLLTPRVLIPLTNYLVLCFTDMGAGALRPLMYSMSITHGGLGFSPYEIGLIMGVWGVVNAVVQVSFAARLMRHFGPKRLFLGSYSALLGTFASFPLLSYFAHAAGSNRSPYVVATLVFQLVCNMFVFMSYGCAHLFVIHSAPNKASLGATNGLAQMCGCIVRSLAPTVVLSLFSITLERQLLGGCLVYVVLILITFGGLRAGTLLPNELVRS